MYVNNEVIINQTLIERVLQIKENESINQTKILEDDLVEQIKLTRLSKMFETCSEEEIIVLILIAIKKYPELVFQILREEFILNKERNGKKNANRKVIWN